VKKVYRKCNNCSGTGSVYTRNYSNPTTIQNDGYNIVCPVCNGSGLEETDYFIEE
jgi:DnaJ-class molecular chaperone